MGDLLPGGGDQRGVIVAGGDAAIAQQRGALLLRGGEPCLGRADGGGGSLARRVAGHLGVGLDGGDVVADGVDAVVGGGVLEEVLLPPPGLQPGQDRRGAGTEVGGEDLQGDVAVLEQGDLAGVAVVLELDGLLGPGDLAGPGARGGGGPGRQCGRGGGGGGGGGG